MAKLPNKIYIVDPYDDDGNLIQNTEDVCWCQDAVGDENVAYIAERSVTDALAALLAKLEKKASEFQEDSEHPETVNKQLAATIARTYRNAGAELDATIAALGLAPKDEGK